MTRVAAITAAACLLAILAVAAFLTTYHPARPAHVACAPSEDEWGSLWDLDAGQHLDTDQVTQAAGGVYLPHPTTGLPSFHRVDAYLHSGSEIAGLVLADGRLLLFKRGESGKVVDIVLANPR